MRGVGIRDADDLDGKLSRLSKHRRRENPGAGALCGAY
jgi:hypothetical protein